MLYKLQNLLRNDVSRKLWTVINNESIRNDVLGSMDPHWFGVCRLRVRHPVEDVVDFIIWDDIQTRYRFK